MTTYDTNIIATGPLAVRTREFDANERHNAFTATTVDAAKGFTFTAVEDEDGTRHTATYIHDVVSVEREGKSYIFRQADGTTHRVTIFEAVTA